MSAAFSLGGQPRTCTIDCSLGLHSTGRARRGPRGAGEKSGTCSRAMAAGRALSAAGARSCCGTGSGQAPHGGQLVGEPTPACFPFNASSECKAVCCSPCGGGRGTSRGAHPAVQPGQLFACTCATAPHCRNVKALLLSCVKRLQCMGEYTGCWSIHSCS